MKPVANLAAEEDNKDSQSKCDITVADILGPLLKKKAGTSAEVADGSDGARDANFSLLSYSFSLVGPSNLKQRTAEMLSKFAVGYGAALGSRRGQGVTPLQVSDPASQPCRAQNPALRRELRFEMAQMHSDVALHFGNNDPVLSREDQGVKTSSKASTQKPMWERFGDALSSSRSSSF